MVEGHCSNVRCKWHVLLRLLTRIAGPLYCTTSVERLECQKLALLVLP